MDQDIQERLKRSVSRVDYAKLVDIKVPPMVRKWKREDLNKSVVEPGTRLYHLSIVDRNPQEGLAKVR